MSTIRHITVAIMIIAATLCLAADQKETSTLFYGTTGYPTEVINWPRARIESAHPELLKHPLIGDMLAFRAYSGTNLLREIRGTVVSAEILACKEGPEINIAGGVIVDLFNSLYLTDILHQSPQDDDAFMGDRNAPDYTPFIIWTPEDVPIPQSNENQ